MLSRAGAGLRAVLPAIGKHPLDEGRHLDAGPAIAPLVEQRIALRRLEVQLHRVGVAVGMRLGDEAVRGIDIEIGRPSCREGGCPYVYISVFAASLKKKNSSANS